MDKKLTSHIKKPLLTDKAKTQILEAIYSGDMPALQQFIDMQYDFNYKFDHPATDLDDRITPLSAAAYLGRLEAVVAILATKNVDLNLSTEDAAFSPLTSACISGNYEIMQLLLETGANPNCLNSAGQAPLAYCFARLDEESNMFENKNLCLKMAELLLDFGADINTIVNKTEGVTLLMQFCGLSMELTPFQADVNFEVVQFLLEHGADPSKTTVKGETAWDLSKKHLHRATIQKLLRECKRKYFHTNERIIPTKEIQPEGYSGAGALAELRIEETSVKCGCFPCYK